MDPLIPPELRETIQSSLDTAKELQTQIDMASTTTGSVPSLPPLILGGLVQAHTAHLLNHASVLGRTMALGSNYTVSMAIVQSMIASTEQMIKDARTLHEHVISLQVTVQRAAKSSPPTPGSKPHHKRPTVEELDEFKGSSCGKNEGEAASSVPTGRRIKAHWKKKTTADEEAVAWSSPKRQLDNQDGLEQALVKRAKLTPGNQAEKRKSDVSMVDAKPESESSSSPPGKQRRREEIPDETVSAVSAVQVEYEDITAEVDSRMQQRQERKEHERKQELGIIDKRKRQSNDSFNVELDGGKEAEKRSRKRKKHMHSEQAGEG